MTGICGTLLLRVAQDGPLVPVLACALQQLSAGQQVAFLLRVLGSGLQCAPLLKSSISVVQRVHLGIEFGLADDQFRGAAVADTSLSNSCSLSPKHRTRLATGCGLIQIPLPGCLPPLSIQRGRVLLAVVQRAPDLERRANQLQRVAHAVLTNR